jgi:hypothetical protein
MKAYVHVGMPKAGSTAIQLGLAEREPELLRGHGIYYGPLDLRFRNDFDVYCAHKAGRKPFVRDLLLTRRRAATDVGAKKVVFSCERFFEIAENPQEFSEFVQYFEDIFEGAVEFIVVYRDPRSFIKSHATQLLYNGGITYGNMGLAFWVARMLRAHYDLRFAVNFINYNRAKKKACLNATFLELVSGEPCHERERFENITPSRPLAYASVLGQICKIEALLQNADINSHEIDLVRSSVSERFDHVWLSSAERTEEKDLFGSLSRLLEDRIEKYADFSIRRLDESTVRFLEKLDNSLIVKNEFVTVREREPAV